MPKLDARDRARSFAASATQTKGIAPVFEIAVQSTIGRRDPDLGLVHSLGLTYLL